MVCSLLHWADAPAQSASTLLTVPVAHRRLYGGGSGQMIASAVGIQPGRPRVLDATAESGKMLSCWRNLAAKQHFIERQPIIAALLEDGLPEHMKNHEIWCYRRPNAALVGNADWS